MRIAISLGVKPHPIELKNRNQSMKAAIINNFGDLAVLKVVTNHPEPLIADNQVEIEVKAASINPLDILTRTGALKFIRQQNFPIVLGNDVAGTVVNCGSQVTHFKEGDHVYGMIDPRSKLAWNKFTHSGAYAERAITREGTLAHKPHNISFEEAAAIPLACLTAYQALLRKACLGSNDRILINGASGGVGTFAVQLAKEWGANVTAVCSGKNFELVAGLGADHVFDYKKTDIREINDQYNCIYDVAVTTSYSQCRHLLVDTGVFISNIASVQNILSSWFHPALRLFGMQRQNTFAFVHPSGKDLTAITKMIEMEKIKPIIDRMFTLDEIQEAHHYVESGKTKGKVVIKIGPE